MMPLRITVSSPDLASQLLAYLRGLGADARTEGDKVIKVVRRHAVIPGEPSHQDLVEIEFVLRAWAAQNRDVRYKVEEAA
jgi:hypothetical protein